MQTRQRQTGSIGVFVVVGVVFAAMLVGGIVLVKKRTSQPVAPAQNPDVMKVATQTASSSRGQSAQTSQKDEDRLAQEKKAAEEKARQEAIERENKKKAEAAEKRAEEERIAKEKEAEVARAAQAQAVTPETPMARTQEQQAGNLPTTGPVEDMLMMVIGAIAIVGAGYVYYHYGYSRS